MIKVVGQRRNTLEVYLEGIEGFRHLNLFHPESAYRSQKVIYLQGIISRKISKTFYGYNRQTLGIIF